MRKVSVRACAGERLSTLARTAFTTAGSVLVYVARSVLYSGATWVVPADVPDVVAAALPGTYVRPCTARVFSTSPSTTLRDAP